MNKQMKLFLESVIDGIVAQDTAAATDAFHNYLRLKSQAILMGEAEDSDEEDEDDKSDDKEDKKSEKEDDKKVDKDLKKVDKDVKKAKKDQKKDVEDSEDE